MTAPAAVEQEERTTQADDGDHDLFSHYVRKADRELAWLTGEPVTALCGKKWLPTRDPEKFPVCPQCKDVWEQLNQFWDQRDAGGTHG